MKKLYQFRDFWLLLLKIYLPERKSKYFILQTNDRKYSSKQHKLLLFMFIQFFFWHNTAIQLQNYKIYLYSALQTQKLVTTPTTYIWYWYYQTCTAFCDQTLQRNTEKRAGPFIKTDMQLFQFSSKKCWVLFLYFFFLSITTLFFLRIPFNNQVHNSSKLYQCKPIPKSSVCELKLLKVQTAEGQVKTQKKEQLMISKHASAGPPNKNAITCFTAKQ